MRIKPRLSAGFSLVEVTLALSVAAFSLVTIFGLLPIGLSSNQASIEQTVAAGMATRLSADLRAAPPACPQSPLYQISIPVSGSAMHTVFLKEDGTVASSPDIDTNPGQNPRYRATLFFAAPAARQKTATMVRILVTWPALTDMAANTPPIKFSGSFETLICLDRN